MTELKLSPWGDRLYVVLEELKESKGLIQLPDKRRERSRVALVAAVGEEVESFKCGDRVLISEYTGVPVCIAELSFGSVEERHKIIREDEILAKVS